MRAPIRLWCHTKIDLSQKILETIYNIINQVIHLLREEQSDVSITFLHQLVGQDAVTPQILSGIP
jgi:hypothetical protein